MIEMGEHAETHMIPRLHAIINGKDLDKKKYGGGFRYCILGPSLFNKDNGIISVNYSNGPLIRAICKIEGFKPTSNGVLHGVVNVKRYCHVTEAFVTQDYVDELVEHISEDKSLVVYCMKKLSKLKLPDNVTIKKIPRDVAVKFKLN
jgi:adenine-specific DNA-methyltransferase